jgi:hypothetical protein
MKILRLVTFIFLAAAMGCNSPLREVHDVPGKQDFPTKKASLGGNTTDDTALPPNTACRALLATRFSSLEQFKGIVTVAYFTGSGISDTSREGTSLVRLLHCSNGVEVTSVLESGVSQDDIMAAKKGSLWAKIGLAFRAPYAVANRGDLERIYTLARRLPQEFEVGDPSFYDLAEQSVANISTEDLAFRYTADTSEKGYINSFNHITAQAFISSIFSEDLADFVADLHERKNMLELTTGLFTAQQLIDPNNNPVDNYVDMINNEWGQELGKQLKERYHITRETWWTPELLADYLNDIQSYYSWAFQIGLKPFRPEDDLVIRFAHKINLVMNTRYG